VSLALDVAAMQMAVATLCGALIGVERQARQRMAGVRTNALVALGAASFVIFSTLFPGDASPTRVAAQIVSGIGFLGAGLIFRDGFTVHGLNTAATLWCSAAVGMMTGAGALPLAALLTAIVLAVNLFLRPLVNWLDVTLLSGAPTRRYRVALICRPEREAELRSLLIRTLSQGGLRLSELDAHAAADGSGIELVALAEGDKGAEQVLLRTVALLAAEPGLSHADWRPLDEA
jgi:putative Mg2+ transporter-C (MgtC) family protein